MNNYILNMLYLLVNQRDPLDPPLPINAQVCPSLIFIALSGSPFTSTCFQQ